MYFLTLFLNWVGARLIVCSLTLGKRSNETCCMRKGLLCSKSVLHRKMKGADLPPWELLSI